MAIGREIAVLIDEQDFNRPRYAKQLSPPRPRGKGRPMCVARRWHRTPQLSPLWEVFHLLATFIPAGPVVIKVIRQGRYHQVTLGPEDYSAVHLPGPVRSSEGHFVKACGLRWLPAMLLLPLPWAPRVWALPFLTVPMPSQR